MLDSINELIVVIKSAYIHIVSLYSNIRVYVYKALAGSFHFRKTLVTRQVEHSVHVG